MRGLSRNLLHDENKCADCARCRRREQQQQQQQQQQQLQQGWQEQKPRLGPERLRNRAAPGSGQIRQGIPSQGEALGLRRCYEGKARFLCKLLLFCKYRARSTSFLLFYVSLVHSLFHNLGRFYLLQPGNRVTSLT